VLVRVVHATPLLSDFLVGGTFTAPPYLPGIIQPGALRAGGFPLPAPAASGSFGVVGGVARRGAGGGPAVDTTTIVVITGAVAVVAVVGLLVYLRVRRNARRAEGEVYHHFLCPGCRRRLRFQMRQVGRKGACSHCGKALTFPPLSKAID
jgi:hypothetical protein